MPAPNPQRVRMFLHEKGLRITEVSVNLLKAEQKQLGDKNPLQQVPFLELEDGTIITESVSICRFLEEENPSAEPKLFGSTALEKAIVDQWIRRIEFQLMVPVGMFWVHAHRLTANLPRKKYPEFGETSKENALKNFQFFENNMKGDFVAGSFFSMADIVLCSVVDFAEFTGITLPETCTKLQMWRAKMKARASANL